MLCPTCATPLSEGTKVCPACGSPTGGVETVALPSGTVLGQKYLVEGVLGQGGFGITYRGKHKLLGMPVAIKEYFPGGAVRQGQRVVLATAGFSASHEFMQEGQVLAKLNHPGIVSIKDVLEENGTAYLVMDFVAGQPLQKRIEESGPLSEAEALVYIRQAADALQVVHQAGLLHQDLKPDNLILTPHGRIVLIDFGASRHFVADKTGNYDRVVTPGYGPLEQYGSQVRRGPFTDIYALGATLFALLSGNPPPPAPDRAIKPGLPDIKGLSPTTRNLLSKSLAIKHSERPANITAFLALLESAPAKAGNTATPTPVRSLPLATPHLDAAKLALQSLANLTKQPANTKAFSCPFCQSGQMHQVQPSDGCPQCGQNTLLIPDPKHLRCPDCRQGHMELFEAQAQDNTSCPLCQKGHLHPPVLKGLRCPACREADLQNQVPKRTLCPLCRQEGLEVRQDQGHRCPDCQKGFLKTGSRRKLLFLREEYVYCECGAEWDVTDEGWRLSQASAKVASLKGHTLSPSDWDALSGRSPQGWRCRHCQAEWDKQGSDYTLKHTLQPTPLLGRTLSSLNWAKLAQRLPPERGSHRCPRCACEFDLDGGQMRLMKDPQGWLPHLRNSVMPLANWQRLAAGKISPNPGLLCNACGAEWDQDGQDLVLVASGRAAQRFPRGHRVAQSGLGLAARGKTSGKPGALCRSCGSEWDLEQGQYKHLKSGQSLSLEAWQAKALGRSSPQNGPTCTACGAEFVVKGDLWELVQAGRTGRKPPFSSAPREQWRYAASGKQSPGPGYRCGSCQAELSPEGNQFRQTFPQSGPLRSLAEWMNTNSNRSTLESQAQSALRQAFVNAEWRAGPDGLRFAHKRASETVLFALKASAGKKKDGRFRPAETGELWFTSERLLFDSAGKVSEIPLDKLEQVLVQSGALLLQRSDRERSVAFFPENLTLSLGLDQSKVQTSVGPAEMASLLDYLRRLN